MTKDMEGKSQYKHNRTQKLSRITATIRRALFQITLENLKILTLSTNAQFRYYIRVYITLN